MATGSDPLLQAPYILVAVGTAIAIVALLQSGLVKLFAFHSLTVCLGQFGNILQLAFDDGFPVGD